MYINRVYLSLFFPVPCSLWRAVFIRSSTHILKVSAVTKPPIKLLIKPLLFETHQLHAVQQQERYFAWYVRTVMVDVFVLF